MIMTLTYRDSSIRVDLDEPIFFLSILADIDSFQIVGDSKFFQSYGCLDTIWSSTKQTMNIAISYIVYLCHNLQSVESYGMFLSHSSKAV
jgi:hypothetical protein